VSEAPSAEHQAPATPASAPEPGETEPADSAATPTPPGADIDPLAEMRASLGLPHRTGGTPIHSNLDVTLRRLGWGMLILGTVFLLLWRILSWVNA